METVFAVFGSFIVVMVLSAVTILIEDRAMLRSDVKSRLESAIKSGDIASVRSILSVHESALPNGVRQNAEMWLYEREGAAIKQSNQVNKGLSGGCRDERK